MISDLNVVHPSWIFPVTVCGLLLWAVFIWKERKRYGQTRFRVNVGVAFLTLLSLALLALQPQTLDVKHTGNIVLLTEGYDKMQLDSLKRTDRSLRTVRYKHNTPIYAKENPPKAIFILGQGIEPFDFWQVEGFPVHYLGGGKLRGITRFAYRNPASPGEDAVFNGQFSRPKKGHTLLLQGPGEVPLDSLVLEEAEVQNFQLRTPMKLQGRYVYTILEKDAKGKIQSQDPIPLEVNAPDTLQILMVNSFPTFETKYLKNYLAEQGHKVLVRSQMTKGRFKMENFNRESSSLTTFSENSLSPFDMLIIDANSLAALGSGERTVLESSIKEKGLGVFIQPTTEYYNTKAGPFSFDFIPDKSKEAGTQGWPKPLLNKSSWIFKPDFKLLALHTYETKTLSAYKKVGVGSVGTTVLENTYELLLQGEVTAYKDLWSTIIGGLSKKNTPLIDWSENAVLAFKDQPYSYSFRTQINDPVIKANEGYTLPIAEEVEINGWWKGNTYPKEIGWQKLYLEQDTTAVLFFYSADASSWKGLRAYSKQGENKRNFNYATGDKSPQKVLKTISPVVFFLIFVLGMGYLWLEPKLK